MKVSGSTVAAEGLRSRMTAGFGDESMVVRAAISAGLAWWIASVLLHSDSASLAPVGAILAAQTTPFATARKSLQRAAGILFGFLLGVAATASIGTNTVSVVLVVLVGMYAGRVMNLGSQMHQIALTAVLVMGAATSFGYGASRLEDNVVGVLVGTLVGLALPAPGFTRRAGEELARLNRQMAALLAEIARGLAEEDWAARTGDWVRRARSLSKELDAVRQAVREAEDAIRWRPRGRFARPRLDRLAEATQCLDHVGHQVRGITRGLYNLTFREGRPPALHWAQHEEPLLPLRADAPAGLDGVLASLAAMLGDLADVHVREDAPSPELRARLAGLLGAAETGFLHTALAQSPAYADWRVLCTAGILEDARKMLHELDPSIGPHKAAFG
ncbi:aromatic acid exporter family protein [Streptomyces sp. NPDC099050]|uniref:FUSC family protein n=1 Tax=Streptomyces sp. NPDC099050 TaxID=3366100 RepID=UPI0037F73653